MPPKNRLTIMIPGGMGLAASQSVRASRPLARVNTGSGSLQKGELLLQLTLEHLIFIRRTSREMGYDDHAQLLEDSKSQYDDLVEELERLQQASKSTSLIDILKRLKIRRDTKALLEAGHELLVTVQSTSDTVGRAFVSYSSTVEEVEENDIPPNAQLGGVILETDEPLEAEGDPFDDPIVPDRTDIQIPSVNVNMYFGCVNADNSDARVTMNN